MAETLATWFVEHLSGSVSREMIVFIVSLLPILELRGGIIAGFAMGMHWLPTFIIAYIGNLLPIPFILLFIRFIFRVLKKHLCTVWWNGASGRQMRKVTKSENTPIGGSIFSLPCPCRGRVHGWAHSSAHFCTWTPKRPSPSLCLAF